MAKTKFTVMSSITAAAARLVRLAASGPNAEWWWYEFPASDIPEGAQAE